MILIFLLAALPVVLNVIIRIFSDDQHTPDFANGFDIMIVAGVLPITIMVLATATFGNELEDKTLSFLVLKPIARWMIVLPKFLAVLAIGGPLLIVSGALSTYIALEGDGQATLSVAVALALGILAYASIFTWAGLVTTRALAFALVYVFLWEGLIAGFLEGIRYVSVRGYTTAIVYGLDEDSFEALGDGAIQLPVAIIGAVAVTIGFIVLSVWRLRQMDVP